MQPVSTGALRPMAGAADAALVTELHELHGAALFDFARHLGLSDEQAADALQETLLRLWRELQRGTLIEQPLGWAYRTCYRLAMEQHRWRRQLARLLPRLAPDPPAYAGPETDPERAAVWSAVDRLPPRQRHAIYLHYAADLPFAAVAEILDISPSAARTHASRGLATLRGELTIEEIT
ncbi:MAG TPA: sigma-70 family RNA polymerase sigma factor [Candidatus Limnocylindria bacterium]